LEITVHVSPSPQRAASADHALTSDELSSIFAVPEATWTSISKRVGTAFLLRDIKNEIARTIPGFPALSDACDEWRTRTFPGLVAQAVALAGYCSSSIAAFAALQLSIAGLDPDQPLPPAVHAEAVAAIDKLHDATVARTVAIAPLTSDVASFRSANAVADAQIETYVARLGPDWAPLAAETGAVDDACGLVLGAWQAIDADLADLASGTFTITTQLLLSLGIASALLSWEHLIGEALAFPSMAAGQDKYLDGSWLTAGA
jgi:hypothetical protein